MSSSKIILLGAMLILTISGLGQLKDSARNDFHVGGTITATQNGISLIPSFSLGHPALMFDMNVGGKRLTFEPFFRFGTNGKPWSFIFWWRYKLLGMERFRMSIGAHPSYVFRTIMVNDNGNLVTINRADRYAALDITPTLLLTKHIAAGVYYLYSHGLDKTSVQNTHFFTLNTSFSQIKLPGRFLAKFNPQVYYLNQDGRDGFYYTHCVTLARQKFPLSVQTIMNKAIRTDIGGRDFVWNLSLIYSFNKSYARRS